MNIIFVIIITIMVKNNKNDIISSKIVMLIKDLSTHITFYFTIIIIYCKYACLSIPCFISISAHTSTINPL